MANNPQRVPQQRTGQEDVKVSRKEFAKLLSERFYDPAFDGI
jgi:hypothetical protein